MSFFDLQSDKKNIQKTTFRDHSRQPFFVNFKIPFFVRNKTFDALVSEYKIFRILTKNWNQGLLSDQNKAKIGNTSFTLRIYSNKDIDNTSTLHRRYPVNSLSENPVMWH